MKNLCTKLLIACLSFTGSGFAQEAASAQMEHQLNFSSQQQTPAQQRIEAATRQVQANPKRIQAFNELANAYLKRARESADPRFLQDAEAALNQGFKLDAGDYQLQKTQVALMLARHEYVQAREKAAELNHHTLDDVMPYGFLAEADIALGNYPDAETNTQWMLNLLQNNVPALLLAARLRTLYGDPNGAIDLLNMAYAETSPTEVEDLAWIANEIAAIQIDTGKIDAADSTLAQADKLFPNCAYVIENQARLRMAQHRAPDAIALLTRARAIDGDPKVVYELARAQQAAGRTAQANVTYSEFERLADNPANRSEVATRDLILLYAGDAVRAPQALKLAQQEIDARHDVWTLDAYAWALFANGKYEEADGSIHKALAVGLQDAQLFDHASRIAEKLNHKDEAAKFLDLAVKSNPASEYAANAHGAAGIPLGTREQALPDSQAGLRPVMPQAAGAGIATTAPTNSSSLPTNAIAATGLQNQLVKPFSPVPAELLIPRATETDRMIRNAQSMIELTKSDPKAYAALGAAHFQRARETGDVSDYQLAEGALNKSLDLDSSDFSADSALGTMAAVCMGEHRFADALAYSQKALSLGSGDVSPFAIVGDAYADMGEYDKAAQAYARLTPPDMTLASHAAYARDSRLSYLKFISGNTDEAIRLMNVAVAEGNDAQIPHENLAWLYYELGEYYSQAGDIASADVAYQTALTVHPGDYRALASLGRLRANQGKYDEAIGLYQKAIAVVPMPSFVAELGDLYARAGNHAESKKQYQLVEYIGLLGHINQVLHNRDLAVFYADHDVKLPEALELAQKELEVRHDIYTWDALSWALYKNGKYDEAALASQKALRFGTRDAMLLFHAGMIADRLGKAQQARDQLKQALQINPHFHLVFAEAAQQKLGSLEAQLASTESAENHAR